MLAHHALQANFEANKHAQTIFGRHEPCLTYRHRAFHKLAELGRSNLGTAAKTMATSRSRL